MISTNQYTGLLPQNDDQIGANCKQIAQYHKDYVANNGMSDLWLMSYCMYYNAVNNSPVFNRIGANFNRRDYIYSPFNVYKNIGKNFLNMIYSATPVQKARTANTDPNVIDKIEIYNSLLEYDYTKKGLGEQAFECGETAWIFASSFAFVEWDFNKGKDLKFDDDKGQRVFTGDWSMDVLTPFDIAFDPTKSRWEDVESVIVRQKKNKYVLASQYPEFEEDILACDARDWVDNPTFNLDFDSFTDDIYIYKYIHKPMPGLKNKDYDLKNGRYVTILSSGVVIEDEKNYYEKINVFPLTFSKKRYSVYGDTDAFDMLPIQKLMNVAGSCMTTRVTAFGIDKIVIPNQGKVAFEDLAGGLKGLKMPGNQQKPDILNFMGDLRPFMDAMKFAESMMEGISGMNQVIRGNPEGLKSGVAISNIEQKAIQYINNAQKNAFKQQAEISNFILELRQKYSIYGDLVPIVGEDKKFKLERFAQSDANLIDSIYLEPVDSVTVSFATRNMMSEKLAQMGINPEEYVTFLKTGRYDRMIDDEFDELNNIQLENEKIKKGEVPLVIRSDNDELHIKKHRKPLQDPDARNNPKIVDAYNEHIRMHEENMVTKAQHQATLQNLLQTSSAPPMPQSDEEATLPPPGSPLGMEATAQQ